MKFSDNRTTTSEGRNGCYTCTGVATYFNDRAGNGAEVILQGMTSRHFTARGDITVPVQDVPALIAELQAWLDRR